MKVLVTGGTGFIGSHTTVQLISGGITPILLDNLHNSKKAILKRLEGITHTKPTFIEGDVRDRDLLVRIMKEHDIEAVIHFAGWKAVGESVSMPLEYYDNNLHGTISLVSAMREAGVKCLVFSSSSTIYGEPTRLPMTEGDPTVAVNPYGRSKLMVEQVLTDFQMANPEWSVILLRYFNPTGAHASGDIGEDPLGVPNNLLPYVAQVAVGRHSAVPVFGNDYPTKDGTGVRDYIHVVDLADGHIAALNVVGKKAGLHIYNLGTGQGSSVLEVIKAFETASGKTIPIKIVPRRPGDIPAYWSSTAKAEKELGWKAKHSLAQMAEDMWRWQSKNPNGFQDE